MTRSRTESALTALNGEIVNAVATLPAQGDFIKSYGATSAMA